MALPAIITVGADEINFNGTLYTSDNNTKTLVLNANTFSDGKMFLNTLRSTVALKGEEIQSFNIYYQVLTGSVSFTNINYYSVLYSAGSPPVITNIPITTSGFTGTLGYYKGIINVTTPSFENSSAGLNYCLSFRCNNLSTTLQAKVVFENFVINAGLNVDVPGGGGTVTTTATTTAAGVLAMASNTTGTCITAFGNNALEFNTTANDNTAVGGYAGRNIVNGSNNSLYGCDSGITITSGTGNTIIGANSDVNSASSIDRIAIGRGAIANIDYSAQIGENTAVPATAILRFHQQTIADASWVGGGTTLASIDNTGSIIRGGASSTGRIVYQLMFNKATALQTTYTALSYFNWIQSRYSSYTLGTVSLYVIIVDRNLLIRLFDTTANASLGELTILATGFYTFSVSNPLVNSVIELQVQKNAIGGTDPVMQGIVLEYN